MKRLISDIILRSYHKRSNCCPFTLTQAQKRLLHSSGMRRLSFCVVKHQRSFRLTSGWPTASTSTLSTTAFGAVYTCTASCIPEGGERCGSTEAAPDRGLVWPAADRCRWGNRRMEKTSPGVCPSKGAAVWTFTVTSDYNVVNQHPASEMTYTVSGGALNSAQPQPQIIMFNDLKFCNLRCFVGVLPCSCLCCGCHRKTSAGTLFLPFITK